LGDWDQAEAHLAHAIELAPDQAAGDLGWVDYLLALLRLRVGDQEGYRSEAIAAINRQSTTRAWDDSFAVWASVITPNSGVDAGRLVELAGHALRSSPDNPDCLTAHGAALYRAGRWEEAHVKLTEAVGAEESFRGIRHGTVIHTQLFLAMTSHQLGKREQAREWLTKAIDNMERSASASPRDYVGMPWDRRLTTQLLRQEAKQLLNDDAGSAR
jgi:tetratricopeptide (TPR) repeat protein